MSREGLDAEDHGIFFLFALYSPKEGSCTNLGLQRGFQYGVADPVVHNEEHDEGAPLYQPLLPHFLYSVKLALLRGYYSP